MVQWRSASAREVMEDERSRKRIVKTPAQVQALEKFYDEHKYPKESLKSKFAESIGLTEKQVSEWFCHRRSKDKKFMSADSHVTGRQARSGTVIQGCGGGQKPDSCGSIKQLHDEDLDMQQIEKQRLNLQHVSAEELTYQSGAQYFPKRTDDTSSASTSSLRIKCKDHIEDSLDMSTSRYHNVKLPRDALGVRNRSGGASGYLKVISPVENPSITAVRRQLGKRYQEDGPPLSVEFDPLPPFAFESSTKKPVDGIGYPEEDMSSPDISEFRQYTKPAKAPDRGWNEFARRRMLKSVTVSDNRPRIRPA